MLWTYASNSSSARRKLPENIGSALFTVWQRAINSLCRSKRQAHGTVCDCYVIRAYSITFIAFKQC